MDFGTLMNRLGRNGQIFVGGALLMFVDSFFPWYSVSVKSSFAGFGGEASTNGWNSGFGAWFPIVLLVAFGVVVVLAALGNIKWTPLMTWTLATGVAILSAIIILLRWLTYPSVPEIEKSMIDAGAGFGTYIGLALAVVMAVFGYLAFTASGGDVKNLGAGFQNTGQTPPAQG